MVGKELAVVQAITGAGGGQATKAVSGAAVVCWAGGRLQEVATHAVLVVVVVAMIAVVAAIASSFMRLEIRWQQALAAVVPTSNSCGHNQQWCS